MILEKITRFGKLVFAIKSHPRVKTQRPLTASLHCCRSLTRFKRVYTTLQIPVIYSPHRTDAGAVLATLIARNTRLSASKVKPRMAGCRFFLVLINRRFGQLFTGVRRY